MFFQLWPFNGSFSPWVCPWQSWSSLWMSLLLTWIRKARNEIAHPSARSVYISFLGCTPVPGQFWTMHDSITKQLGNVSWCSFLFLQFHALWFPNSLSQMWILTVLWGKVNLLIKRHTFVLRKREMVYSDLVSSISFEDNNGRVEGVQALVPDRAGFKSHLQLSLLPVNTGQSDGALSLFPYLWNGYNDSTHLESYCEV